MRTPNLNPVVCLCGLAGLLLSAALPVAANAASFLSSLAASPNITASTIPTNGDVNPYGVAFVPQNLVTSSALSAGDVLVSNFNNSSNLQGTGSTIVKVSTTGTPSLFYQGPKGIGLTTALDVLKSGFVIVGNTPTTDGTTKTISSGSLIVLDDSGNFVENLTDNVLLDGPWDMSIQDFGQNVILFVSNVLDGSVSRISLIVPAGGIPRVVSETKIATGYAVYPNAAALIVGPTGLAFDVNTDSLYVASTGNNSIYVVSRAFERNSPDGPGKVVYHDPAHLRGPLGLIIAPNGDLVTSNGDAINANSGFPSELVEFTKTGKFVDQRSVDSSGEGGAFGIAIQIQPGGVDRFAAVDDVTNSVDIWIQGP